MTVFNLYKSFITNSDGQRLPLQALMERVEGPDHDETSELQRSFQEVKRARGRVFVSWLASSDTKQQLLDADSALYQEIRFRALEISPRLTTINRGLITDKAKQEVLQLIQDNNAACEQCRMGRNIISQHQQYRRNHGVFSRVKALLNRNTKQRRK